MKKTKFLIFFGLFSLYVSAKDYVINPGPDAYENLQEAMILMSPGDSILIKSGDYFFEDSLKHLVSVYFNCQGILFRHIILIFKE